MAPRGMTPASGIERGDPSASNRGVSFRVYSRVMYGRGYQISKPSVNFSHRSRTFPGEHPC